MNVGTHPLVGQYLRRLRDSMSDIPAERRDDIVAEIEEHIEEAMAELPSTTEADVRNLMERKGDPADIAAEARERSTLSEPKPVQADRWRKWLARGTSFLRRRLRILLIGLLVLLLTFAGSATWFVSQFVPLRANLAGATSLVPKSKGVTCVRAFDPPTAHPFGACFIPYHDGETVEYGYTLTNNSPFSVTIERIMVSTDDPFRNTEVWISEGEDIPTDASQVRTRHLNSAFTLRPHRSRFILVKSVLGGCPFVSPANPGLSADGLAMYRHGVRFRYLGISRSEFLPLPYSIAISGREGCPSK